MIHSFTIRMTEHPGLTERSVEGICLEYPGVDPALPGAAFVRVDAGRTHWYVAKITNNVNVLINMQRYQPPNVGDLSLQDTTAVAQIICDNDDDVKT